MPSAPVGSFRIFRDVSTAACFALLAGCAPIAPQKTVTQVSTIDALLAGAYDGQVATGALHSYGNTGIGTFDKLDGEMVVKDGVVYQVKSDGSVRQPPASLKTPFAVVTDFRADRSFAIHGPVTLAQLEQEIDRQCPDPNGLYTIRITGTFPSMKTRSVPAQHKPYPALVDASKHQSVFNLRNVSGTLIGFRCPPYMKGINVTGYHLHFLADDLKTGGHVLDLLASQGKVEIAFSRKFVMLLPGSEATSKLDLKKDRSAELEKVEKSH